MDMLGIYPAVFRLSMGQPTRPACSAFKRHKPLSMKCKFFCLGSKVTLNVTVFICGAPEGTVAIRLGGSQIPPMLTVLSGAKQGPRSRPGCLLSEPHGRQAAHMPRGCWLLLEHCSPVHPPTCATWTWHIPPSEMESPCLRINLFPGTTELSHFDCLSVYTFLH